MKNKTLLLFIAILTSFAGFSQGPISTMTTVTTTSSSSLVPIVDNATGANRKISIGNLVTVGAGNYLIKGTNTYTANTVIAPVGTFSLYSSGLSSVGSPSIAITGSSVLLSGAGTPGAYKILTSDASGYATWQTAASNTTIAGGSTTQLQYNNAGALGGTGITYSSDASYNYFTAPSPKGIFLRNSTGDQRIYADDTFTEIIANYSGGANGSSVTLQSGSITNTAAAHYWYTAGGNDYRFGNDVAGGGTEFGILDFGSISSTNKTFTFPNTTGTIALTSDIPTTASGTITPTATNTVNIDAITPLTEQYMRVGSVVTVSGGVEVDPTAAAQVSFSLSVPVSTGATVAQRISGVGVTTSGALSASISNNTGKASFVFQAPSGTAVELRYTYTYLIE